MARTTSLIVLAWNRWALTEKCVGTLLATDLDGAEVIVVDNGSTDETPERLASFTGVRVVTLPENLGFVRGNNAGIAAADPASDVVLPRAAGRHVVALRVDLLTGACEASLDGSRCDVRGGPISTEDGSFHGQLVLWDLRGAKNLAAASVLRFTRHAGSLGKIELAEPGLHLIE